MVYDGTAMADNLAHHATQAGKVFEMIKILQVYLVLDHWRKQLEKLEELEGEAEARWHVVIAAWL